MFISLKSSLETYSLVLGLTWKQDGEFLREHPGLSYILKACSYPEEVAQLLDLGLRIQHISKLVRGPLKILLRAGNINNLVLAIQGHEQSLVAVQPSPERVNAGHSIVKKC